MSDATATQNQRRPQTPPPDELHTDDDALSVLLDGDIDKVMSGLDKIVEAAPSYEKLFMRWQRQHWSTEDFDFAEDAKQWADPDMFTDEERKFLEFGFSEFFLGEERVTVELLPFAIAAPTHEERSSSPRRSPTRRSTPSSGTASIARSSGSRRPASAR